MRAISATNIPAAVVSPAQLRYVLVCASLGTLPDARAPLLDTMRGSAFVAYVRQWPARETVLRRLLHGDTPTAAADGICDRTTAGRWLWSFLVVAAGVVDRRAKADRDRNILKSICWMTHGRQARGGNGGRGSGSRSRSRSGSG